MTRHTVGLDTRSKTLLDSIYTRYGGLKKSDVIYCSLRLLDLMMDLVPLDKLMEIARHYDVNREVAKELLLRHLRNSISKDK